MTTVEQIFKHIDVETLLDNYNLDHHFDGDAYRMACPIHGGKNPSSFIMMADRDGLYYCHSCGATGDAIDFVQEMENISFKEAAMKLAAMFSIEVNAATLYKEQQRLEKELKKWKQALSKELETFEEYKLPDAVYKDVKKYASFNKETLDFFEVKFVDSIDLLSKKGNTYTSYKQLVFPIVFDGTFIGMALRAMVNNPSSIKWNLQPVNMHFGRVFYNYDNVKEEDNELLIVEGIKDVMAFHEIDVTAIAAFGAHLTKPQYELVIKSGKDVVLCYDGDEAGEKAFRKAVDMLRNKVSVYKIPMLPGEDAESISREELYERWKRRHRVA